MDASDNKAKPKTVATIDIQILPPKINKSDWMSEMVNEHFHCVLCGAELSFAHKTDFASHVVKEDATCTHCHVRNRQSTYTLQ